MVRALWITVSFLSLIMVVVATRRILHLSAPAMELDAGFDRHSLLTVSHVVSGLVFVALGPFQFMAGLRKRRPALHRWMGRLFLADSLPIGVTALIVSPQMAIGGGLETSATFFFGLLFLFALGRAFASIRAYAIGLGVATVRPIVGVFFATSRITHLTPHEFFGIAFWLGFIVSVAVAEVWIHAISGSRQGYKTRGKASRPIASSVKV